MKKNYGNRVLIYHTLKKTLRIMRIVLFFLLVSIFQTIASVGYPQNAKITLKGEELSLEDVLNKIEAQTEYRFIYDKSQVDLEKKVRINFEEVTLAEVLEELFVKKGVKYQMIANQIIFTDIAFEVLQQQKTVSGKVTDSGGQPLPGVTVVVKGTTQGTITNADGKYSLGSIPDNATLVFSFVGMRAQEVVVGSQTNINVEMEEETIGIDEVVAIGYGTVKKQDLTGSVSKIKSESLEERAITTLGEAFAGQLAGVRAREKSGEPGQELSITIRGVSTINASNAPLYVVDGIPVSNIQDFNPNDIESIEVLKDASSAAIYGARGANGVVILTTKRGTKQKPVFNFNAYYGLQRVDGVYDLMNRDEFLAYNIWAKNMSYLRSGGSLSDPMSARTAAEQIPESWLNDPESLPDTDWQGELYRTAPMQNYSLNVSGGGDIGTFLISGSYMKQDGILIETGYERFNLRLNTTLNVGNNIQIGMNIAPSFSTKQPTGGTSSVHRGGVFPPIVPLDSNTEETGYAEGAFAYVNPVEELKQTHRENKINKVLSNVWGEWGITNSLSFKSQFGYNYSESQNSFFKPKNVNRGNPSYGNASVSQGYNYSLQNTLMFNPNISSLFDVNLLLGQSIESYKSYYISASATDYPNDLIHTLNVASTKTGASTSEAKNSIASFFSRLNFNVDDKYLLTVNLRRDGSSKFGRDTKWGWFPSASVGWKIDRESFMQDTEWLDLLKLRVMTGVAGNDNIGNYEHIAALGITNYNLNGAIANGLAPSSVGNPDLGWETKVTKGIGIDFSALNNRIQANLDYYIDDTKDMLLNSNISYMTGHGSMRSNLGEVQNRGWEFELTTHNIRKQFNWITSLNLSRNINEVKKLGVDDAPIIITAYGSSAFITTIGEPIGSFYMYKTDGLLLPKDFDENGEPLVPVAPGQEPGNTKIVDVNKDGKINSQDITIVGNNQPDLIFGFNNQFKYKNFDLNILLQGQVGSKIWHIAWRYFDSGQYQGMNSLKHWVHSYKPDSPTGEDPYPQHPFVSKVDLSSDGKSRMRFGNNPSFSDWELYDASFLRIKNITLGYNFSKSISQRIGFDNIRIYVMSDNFYTWDKYIGPSPESTNWGNETTSAGVDNASYGLSRRYSFGIDLTF
ncbi:SusC/RagA family TonB-linked outer membrane protein [Mariniphaga sediminis]|jgi:TonB-linked SusC/RagA family outer membrane protein|uniref:SusC/RagA family TonB-linked outer membrane protein n=1 Tax=Mariniphaga sediminis TaxID=1628158 RepID=A0A399CXN9_9BACT|nr:TonB-dependent receptor [Mariniphaga sediminis]RIH62830.1 SusC/RagA family TonB-linked outer membrane protein [Mariniphaga sediminis]